MSYNSSALYRDAGCPSQCMSENDYYGVMGESAESCPAGCLSDYATPDAGMSCPSVCNFNSLSQYSTLPGYYNAIKVPATTASRIIQTPSIIESSQVFNPEIASVTGNVVSPLQVAQMQQAAEARREAFRFNRRRAPYS